MPLPLLFIGVAAATGGLGAGKAIKAGVDASHAKRINRSANEIVEASTAQLNAQRFACGKALDVYKRQASQSVTSFSLCDFRFPQMAWQASR